MDENEFVAIIRPLESFAAAHPGLYRLRVALLAALGYAYLLVIVSVLLAIIVVTLSNLRFNWVMLKILWIPLALVGIVLRSFWITLPEPDGMKLQREQAPVLFDLIEEVRGALSGPKIHHVIISEDFNASITQIPQFGMFGWRHNYLVVGLPYMQAVSPAEFRSTLAHEVGHLAGKHSRFRAWIYHLRQSWSEILARVEQERHYASFLFEPFIKWYAPYLNAYSFVLARAQEIQADQYCVELAGKEVAAVELVRATVKAHSLSENFWPNFFRQSKDQPKTPPDPFVQMLGALEQPMDSMNTQKWFFEALREPTGYADTHPALADRLAAMGYAKDSPELNTLIGAVLRADENTESAASYYIKDLPEDFLPWVNRLWRERIAPSWKESHEQIKRAKKRFSELEEQAGTRQLTLDEQWERAELLGALKESVDTLPALDTILSEHPDHLGANFAKGAILVKQTNSDGIRYLEKAMQLDPATTGDASSLISGFYFDQSNNELAEAFRKRASEFFEQQRKEQEEAFTISGTDQFIPHGLDEQTVKGLQDQLSKVLGLKAAYLVRKVLTSSDKSPYVLAALADYTWKEGRSDKHIDLLFDELMKLPGLPAPILFLSLDGRYGYLLPKLAAVDGAELFATAGAGVS